MNKIRILFFLFSISFYSCAQNKVKTEKINNAAARFTYKIIPLSHHIENIDSCNKALLILDSATAIDNNCFLCHYNKIIFIKSLKNFDKGIDAINNCIRLKPASHDLYMTAGILYELKGDSVNAAKVFKKSLAICQSVLDTMPVTNSNYIMLASNKAANLIMLKKQDEASRQLQKLYHSQTDDLSKQIIGQLMNKSREDIISEFNLVPEQ